MKNIRLIHGKAHGITDGKTTKMEPTSKRKFAAGKGISAAWIEYPILSGFPMEGHLVIDGHPVLWSCITPAEYRYAVDFLKKQLDAAVKDYERQWNKIRRTVV